MTITSGLRTRHVPRKKTKVTSDVFGGGTRMKKQRAANIHNAWMWAQAELNKINGAFNFGLCCEMNEPCVEDMVRVASRTRCALRQEFGTRRVASARYISRRGGTARRIENVLHVASRMRYASR